LDEPKITELLVNEFKNATNMTDQVSALAAICQNPGAARSQALSDFYEQWKEDALV
jgi:aminopeptidase N